MAEVDLRGVDLRGAWYNKDTRFPVLLFNPNAAERTAGMVLKE